MSKEDRKTEVLTKLEELRYELYCAMNAVDEIIKGVGEAKTKDEILDAMCSLDWDDLQENATYIEGDVGLLSDIKKLLDVETISEME